MLQQTVSKAPSWDILGGQLAICLEFARSGFQTEMVFQDHVTSDDATGEEIFALQNERWLMREESLPGDLAIKAIAVDKARIFLEVSPIDLPAAQEAFTERALPVSPRPQSLRDATGWTLAKRVAVLPGNPGEGISPRQLWAIPWQQLSRLRQQLTIAAFDAIYTASAWSREGEEEESGGSMVSGPSASSGMGMRLQMGLQLQLQQEQRPVLLLQNRPDLLHVQRLELRAIMALQQRLLHMNAAELEAWAAEQIAQPGGQRRVYGALVFTLARRVKEASKESITWRQARQVARRLVAHPELVNQG